MAENSKKQGRHSVIQMDFLLFSLIGHCKEKQERPYLSWVSLKDLVRIGKKERSGCFATLSVGGRR